MSDPFIDALHERLRSATSTSVAGQEEDENGRSAALSRWWDEFADVLGQKVGAWNERQAPGPPINFTKRADGSVDVRHRSAEATFTRDGRVIRGSMRLGTEPTRDVTIELDVSSDGAVVATVTGEELGSATAAAERVIEPILVEAFPNSRRDAPRN